MEERRYGVLTEQGYFGTGFGFNEAAEEDKEKVKKDLDEEDKEKQ